MSTPDKVEALIMPTPNSNGFVALVSLCETFGMFLANRERYITREAMVMVNLLRKNFDAIISPKRKEGTFCYEQFAKLPDFELPDLLKIFKEDSIDPNRLSDIITTFFSGIGKGIGPDSIDDPTRMNVYLSAERAEPPYVLLWQTIQSLQKKGNSNNQARDTFVVWGLPHRDDRDFRRETSSLEGSLLFGPNIIFIVKAPVLKNQVEFGYNPTAKFVEETEEKLTEVLSMIPGRVTPKCVVIYIDTKGSPSPQSIGVSKEENGIPTEVTVFQSGFSLDALNSIQQFEWLSNKIKEDVITLSQGDLLLLQCLLYAFYKLQSKHTLTSLTPAVVIMALENYLMAYGVENKTATDKTTLQYLLFMVQQAQNPGGILDTYWEQSAFNHLNSADRSKVGGILEILLVGATAEGRGMLLFSDYASGGERVPYSGPIAVDKQGRLGVPSADMYADPTPLFLKRRIDPGLLRLLNWLLGKGCLLDTRQLESSQINKEGFYSVICSHCESIIPEAKLIQYKIVLPPKYGGCTRCGSLQTMVKVEYVKK